MSDLPATLILDKFDPLLNYVFTVNENKFRNLKSNVERVNFFLQNKQLLNDAKKCFNNLSKFSLWKCDHKSREFCKTGDAHFNNGKYLEAIGKYTAGLACAQSDDVASFAYSNRSAVLFMMDLYQECLTDIDRALEHGYPHDLHTNLLDRKKNAERMKTTQHSNISNIVEIPEAYRNRFIQSASDCIEIRTNKEFGKHIVAARDIEVGELLVVEKPYTSMLVNEATIRCHHCLKCCYNLIPCKSCCALYCSELCREKAYECYHQHECSVQSFMMKFFGDFNQTMMFALRMTLLATKCGDSVVDNTIYRSDRYYEISELETYRDKFPLKKIYTFAYMASTITYFLKKSTNIFSESKASENRFKDLLLLNLQISSIYLDEVSQPDENYESNTGVYGLGIYSLGSLFTLSCYPNVFEYTAGSTMIRRALSRIKKGEQCFSSNGALYPSGSKYLRQIMYEKLRYYSCKCRACEEDWLPKDDYKECKNFAQVARKLGQVDRKVLTQHLYKLIMDLNKLENPVIKPSDEVIHIREKIKIAYHYLDCIS